jgi:glutathione-regulated potassium-efflux system ancillary protein KefC
VFGIARGQQAAVRPAAVAGRRIRLRRVRRGGHGAVFSEAVASILVVVVALSMVVTPLTLMLYDRVLAPRYRGSKKKRKADAIEPNEDHVIVAGFGRFGQIVGRFLHANHVRLTVLDHDPDQIEVLRNFGFKVFYGDATRADLLRAAGAAKARALVVAIDDIDDSLALVDAVRREYPDLPIFARARNVTHYFQLRDRGVDMIERETYEAALKLGRTVLSDGLGQSAYRTRQAANRFRRHNRDSLEAVYPYYKDREKFVSLTRQAREELEEMIARDRRTAEEERSQYWD